MQLKTGSATVPVAPVGVPPTGPWRIHRPPNGLSISGGDVFGGTPKTAGGTPRAPNRIASFRLTRTMQLKTGSATVPVAPVGVPPTGPWRIHRPPNGLFISGGDVFGATPKTAGGTPRAPNRIASFRLKSPPTSRRTPTAFYSHASHPHSASNPKQRHSASRSTRRTSHSGTEIRRSRNSASHSRNND